MPEKGYWHSFPGHYLPHKNEKRNKDMHETVWWYVTDALGYLGVQALSSLCVFPSFFPVFLLLYCEVDPPPAVR